MDLNFSGKSFLLRVEMVQERVQGCRLARAGRSHGQQDTIGFGDHVEQHGLIGRGKTEIVNLQERAATQDPHDHVFFFADGRGGLHAQFNDRAAVFQPDFAERYPGRHACLDRIAARGDFSSGDTTGLEDLLTTVCVNQEGASLPVASCLYAGLGGDVTDDVMLQLVPVHFRPDRDRLLLFPLEPDIIAKEAESPARLVELFSEHFADMGCRFEYLEKISKHFCWVILPLRPMPIVP